MTLSFQEANDVGMLDNKKKADFESAFLFLVDFSF